MICFTLKWVKHCPSSILKSIWHTWWNCQYLWSGTILEIDVGIILKVPQKEDVIIQQPKSAINLENGPNPEQSLKEPPLKTISDTDPRPSRRLPTRKSSVQSTYGWLWYVRIRYPKMFSFFFAFVIKSILHLCSCC